MPCSLAKCLLSGQELMVELGGMSDEILFLDVESVDRVVVHRVDRVHVSTRSPFQRIDVFHTPRLGLTLALDGIIQLAQSDEQIYHELLVHPACLLLSSLRSALILGGGDGCAARELLRYPELESLELVEMDQAVLDVCRTHLREVNAVALDDPRLTVVVQEARVYLGNHPEKRYDLIVLDLTDPYDAAGRPGELTRSVFSGSYYEVIKGHMSSGGVLVAQTGGLIPNPSVNKSHAGLIDDLRRSFATVATAYEYIPSFDQVWSITLASDYPYDVRGLDPDTLLREKGISGLRHYDGSSHRKAFESPRHIRDISH